MRYYIIIGIVFSFLQFFDSNLGFSQNDDIKWALKDSVLAKKTCDSMLKKSFKVLEIYPDSAFLWALESYRLSEFYSFNNEQINSLWVLRNASELKKEYKQALDYSKRLIQILSATDSNHFSKLMPLDFRQNSHFYDIQKIKKETIKEYKSKLTYGLLIGFFVFLLPIMVILFRYLKIKKVSEENKQQQELRHKNARDAILKRTRELELELKFKSQEMDIRRKLRDQQNKIYEQEKELMNKRAEYLQDKLEYKNKELTTKALFIAQNNALIADIINELKEVAAKTQNTVLNKKILSIQNNLKRKLKDNGLNEFEILFKEVHSSFYGNLLEKFPDITPNERKLCAFLRLNMSTKEISEITYQSQNTINMARTRLRKKMKISRDENIITFLSKL